MFSTIPHSLPLVHVGRGLWLVPVGVASPRAHGQAVTRTEMKKLKANRNGDIPDGSDKGN